jgi:hypothetical protein
MQMYMTDTDRVLCAEYRSGDGKGVKKKKRTRIKKADHSLSSAAFDEICNKLANCQPAEIFRAVWAEVRSSLCGHSILTSTVNHLDDNPQCLDLVNSIFNKIMILFRDTYKAVRKPSRSSTFLRALTKNVRLSQFFPRIVADIVEDLSDSHARLLSAHIVGATIAYFYRTSQVNKYSDRTPLSSPLPSGEAMVAGWALFSARRYFLRWRAWSTQKKHALIDQCVQLVNHLTVHRDDTKQTTTAATFFHLYSEGGLRLPVFGLLV